LIGYLRRVSTLNEEANIELETALALRDANTMTLQFTACYMETEQKQAVAGS
ncbi:unnamed protein product, partial [Arctia plantaginis]